MFQVWQIVNGKMDNNKHGLDREEKWDLKMIAEFKTEAEAKHCVIQNTLTSPSTPDLKRLEWHMTQAMLMEKSHKSFLLIPGDSEEEFDEKIEKARIKFYNEFCFGSGADATDKYLQYRRFFIGKPNKKMIERIVVASGAVYKPMS